MMEVSAVRLVGICVLATLPTANGFVLHGALAKHAAAPRSLTVELNFFNDLKRGIDKLQAGSYDEAAVKAEVEREIARKPCIMYSLSSCPFCKEAKGILSGMGAVYTIVEVDVDEGGMAKKAELAGIIDRTSLPAVFAGGSFLGGCNDGGLGGIATLHKKGELAPLLIKSGALSATQRI